MVQVEEFVKPKPESVAAVHAWLREHDVQATTISPAGDWLAFNVPVNKANAMFAANFSQFTHVRSGETSIRTLAYSIPANLKEHISLVHPTTS